jgi:transcriptional regulator of acetoin/glycerol metabolism
MLTAEARDALLCHSWPGNVRELRKALERAAILCEGDVIDSAHLALQSARPTCRESTDLGNVERALIVKIMSQERWNKSKAARLLGITRTQLYYRLRKHRLER